MHAGRRGGTGALLALALVVAGCAGGDEPSGGTSDTRPSASPESADPDPEAGAATAPAAPTEPPDGKRPDTGATGRVVTTGSSAFGTMLFDGTGQAIYLFDKERTARSRCYGACAEEWPPVLTAREPRARGQARNGLLGTTERRDGSTQVTYAGHPLYYYAHEGRRQVLCHDVEGFGGLWLVVTPKGTPAA